MERSEKINIISGLYCFAALILYTLDLGGKDLHLLALGIPIIGLTPFILIRNEKFQNEYLIHLKKIKTLVSKINPLFYFWSLFTLSLLMWLITYFHMFDRFGLGAFDSGIYGNIAFNTASGEPFYSSVLEKNHLGEHFSPIVTIFAPFYLIKADLRWLLTAQAISFSLVPIIIYRISGSYTKKKSEKIIVSLSLSILWLIYTPMRSAMIFPFHPSSIAAPLILLAFAYLIEGKIGRMSITLFTLLFFKENLTFVLIGFSLYLFFHEKDYKKSLFLFIIGSTALFLIVLFIIPTINGDGFEKLSRLGIFEDWGLKFSYIFALFLPLGFLPIIFWKRGIIALPAIMQNLVVKSEPMYSSQYHYDDLIAPLLFTILPGIIICCLIPILNRFNLNKTILISLSFFLLLNFYVKQTPLEIVWKNPITDVQKGIKKELIHLTENYQDEIIYFQHYLFPHINRNPSSKVKTMPLLREGNFSQCYDPKMYPVKSILVFAKTVPKYPIKDLEKCIAAYSKSSNAVQINKFNYLTVFEISSHDEEKLSEISNIN